MFQTATGCAVFEPRLGELESKPHSSWKKTTIEPFLSTALAAYMKRAFAEPSPDFDPPFHIFQASLGPESIMASGDDGVITGIIAWDIAAY